MKPEDQIKFRKAGYAFMSWNMGKIKAQTIDNPASFNKDQVLAAASWAATPTPAWGPFTAQAPTRRSAARRPV
jgi:hypothetical protein